MKLKNINYKSAAFFGLLTFVFTFVQGSLGLILSAVYPSQEFAFAPVQALVSAPLIGGFMAYLFAILVIVVYNFSARKGYPISWESKK
tara:strand:+ start:298 stop:561 length:264 start_codon:yes stop_codon:yes gene_type:complete